MSWVQDPLFELPWIYLGRSRCAAGAVIFHPEWGDGPCDETPARWLVTDEGAMALCAAHFDFVCGRLDEAEEGETGEG